MRIFINDNIPEEYCDRTQKIIERIKKRNLRAGDTIIINNYEVMIKRYDNLRYIILKRFENNCENYYILDILLHNNHQRNYDDFNRNIRNNTNALNEWIRQRMANIRMNYGNNIAFNIINNVETSFLNHNYNNLIEAFSERNEIYESPTIRQISAERAGVLFSFLNEHLNNNGNIVGNNDFCLRNYKIIYNGDVYRRTCIGTIEEIQDLDNKLNNINNSAQKLNHLISFVLGQENQGVAYPDWYLCDINLWSEVRATPGVSLSQEEEEIINNIVKFTQVENPFPLFIRGRAGSGKTLILNYAMAYFIARTYIIMRGQNLNEESIENLYPLYVTKSEKLKEKAIENVLNIIKKIENGWRDFNGIANWFGRNMKNFFKTYDNLIFSILNNQNNTYLDFENFSRYYRRTYGQNPNYSGISSWLAWYVLNAYILGYRIEEDIMTPDDYRDLPRERKNVSEEVFKKVFQIYENLRNNNQFDIKELFQYKVSEALSNIIYDRVRLRFGAIICDEAQDFTRNDFELFFRLSYFSDKNLNGISKRKIPLIFAADEFQTVNPTNFSWDEIRSFFYDLLGGNLNDYNLSFKYLGNNYRSAKNIVDLANNVLRSRFEVTGERFQQIQTPLVNYNGNIRLFRIDINNLINHYNDIGSIVFITPDENTKERLRREIENLVIYTTEEIKGLEFKRIAVFDFFNNIPDNILNGNPNNDQFLELKYLFSKLYVALTRAKSSLYIITTNELNNNTLNYFGLSVGYSNDVSFNDNYNNLFTYIENINTMIINENYENVLRQIEIAVINDDDVKWILNYFKNLININLKDIQEDSFRNFIIKINNLRVGRVLNENLLNGLEISNKNLLERFFYTLLKGDMNNFEIIKNFISRINGPINRNTLDVKNSFKVIELGNDSYPNRDTILSLVSLIERVGITDVVKQLISTYIDKFASYQNFTEDVCFETFLDFIYRLQIKVDFDDNNINKIDNLIMRKIRNRESNTNEMFNKIKKSLSEVYREKMSSYKVISYYTSNNYIEMIEIYDSVSEDVRNTLNLNNLFDLVKDLNFNSISSDDIKKILLFLEKNFSKINKEEAIKILKRIIESNNYNYEHYDILKNINFEDNREIKNKIEESSYKFLDKDEIVSKVINKISNVVNINEVSMILRSISKYNFSDNSLFRKLKEFFTRESNINQMRDFLDLISFCALYENILNNDELIEFYTNSKVFNKDKMKEEEWRFTRIRLYKLYSNNEEISKRLKSELKIEDSDLKDSDKLIMNAKFELKIVSEIELKEGKVVYNSELNVYISFRGNKIYITYNNLPQDFELKEGKYIHQDTNREFSIRKEVSKYFIEFENIPVRYFINIEPNNLNNNFKVNIEQNINNIKPKTEMKKNVFVLKKEDNFDFDNTLRSIHRGDKISEILLENFCEEKIYYLNIDVTGNVLHKPNCYYINLIKKEKLKMIFEKDIGKYKYRKCRYCFGKKQE